MAQVSFGLDVLWLSPLLFWMLIYIFITSKLWSEGNEFNTRVNRNNEVVRWKVTFIISDNNRYIHGYSSLLPSVLNLLFILYWFSSFTSMCHVYRSLRSEWEVIFTSLSLPLPSPPTPIYLGLKASQFYLSFSTYGKFLSTFITPYTYSLFLRKLFPHCFPVEYSGSP